MKKDNTMNETHTTFTNANSKVDFVKLIPLLKTLSLFQLNELYHIMTNIDDKFQELDALNRFLLKVGCDATLRNNILTDWYTCCTDNKEAKRMQLRKENGVDVIGLFITHFEERWSEKDEKIILNEMAKIPPFGIYDECEFEGDIDEDDEAPVDDKHNADRKPGRVAAKVYIPHEDPMLPGKTVWLEDNDWVDMNIQLSRLTIKYRLEKVEIQRYARPADWDGDWIYMDNRTFLSNFYTPEFMMLVDLPGQSRFRSHLHNVMCVHTPSGLVIRILMRNWQEFTEEGKSYRISYNFNYRFEDGGMKQMMAVTWVKKVLDAERAQKIKYDILKRCAIWFCDYLKVNGTEHNFEDFC